MGSRVRMLFAGAAVLLAAAACTSAKAQDPDWQGSPAPNGVEGSPGAHLQPILPTPPQGDQPSAPGSGPKSPGRSGSSPNSKLDPLVVATHLTTPTAIAMLPDGTALVGERSTGRIVRVQPVAGKPVPTVRTLSGVDGAGDGGLLDLALSPTFDQDNLIYAYITTAKDNRIVDFTLNGPVTPVLTGIPKGRTDNTGRIVFGADGDLYVGTGDTGRAKLAADPHSLAGKILRLTSVGGPAPGNPIKHSAIYARGLTQVNGLCTNPDSDGVLAVQTTTVGAPSRIDLVRRRADYASAAPTATLPAPYTSAGGCAVLSGQLWVTSLDAQAVVGMPLSKALVPGKPTPALAKKYGRLKTVVAAADGVLWLTTSNQDGHGRPVAADERVIRYVPNASSGGGGSKA